MHSVPSVDCLRFLCALIQIALFIVRRIVLFELLLRFMLKQTFLLSFQVLSESFLLDAHVSEQNENSGQILQKYAESIEKDPLSSAILHKDKSKEVDSDPNELATTYLPEVKTKREVGFLNKCKTTCKIFAKHKAIVI